MRERKDIYMTSKEKVVFWQGVSLPEFLPCAAGVTYADPNYHIRRFNSKFYVFEYIRSGTGYAEFGGELVHLSEGDAYILHPNTFHHYYSDHRRPWEKVWLNIQGSMISHLLSDYHLSFNCYIRGLSNGGFLDSFLDTMEQDPRQSKNKLALLLHQHISLFSEAYNALTSEPSAALAMKNYIDENLTRSLSIEELAAHVSLSRSRALHLFKEEYGVTPYHYFLSQRLELAQNMLSSTCLPIQEISNMLGFPDYRHFTSQFKKWTGVTPTYFRSH